jgi:hypothetical protein
MAGLSELSVDLPVLIDHSTCGVLKWLSPIMTGASLEPIPASRQRCHSGVF